MPELPANVRRFLRDVDSLESLEVLLLLRRDPARRWRIDEIVAELRSTVYAIRGRLEVLRRRDLAAREAERWRYGADEKTDAVVGDVADCYEHRRLRVIEALYGGERRDPLRAFADAFRLRDDDDGDDASEEDGDEDA